MQVSKRLTTKSGITIPKAVREEAGFMPGMAVDIENMPDGSIRIWRHAPTCRFCGSIEQVIYASGMEMCKACAAKLIEEVGRYGV